MRISSPPLEMNLNDNVYKIIILIYKVGIITTTPPRKKRTMKLSYPHKDQVEHSPRMKSHEEISECL